MLAFTPVLMRQKEISWRIENLGKKKKNLSHVFSTKLKSLSKDYVLWGPSAIMAKYEMFTNTLLYKVLKELLTDVFCS